MSRMIDVDSYPLFNFSHIEDKITNNATARFHRRLEDRIDSRIDYQIHDRITDRVLYEQTKGQDQ